MFKKFLPRRKLVSATGAARPDLPETRQTVEISEVAALEVLSMFRFPADPSKRVSGAWSGIWHEKLGAPFASVAEAFFAQGLLREATRLERLIHMRTLEELREIARERRLKVSGVKADVAKRVLESEDTFGALKIQSNRLFICSYETLAAVEKYMSRLKIDKQAAKDKTRKQIQDGETLGACKTISDYESSQFFPRGMGLDWNNEAKRLLPEVNAALESTPKFHKRRLGAITFSLRLSAAMAILWGERLPLEKDDIGEMSRDDFELFQRMLISHAHYLRLKGQAQSLSNKRGDVKIEILASNDSKTTCSACLGDSGKTYEIGMAPELPHEFCECTIGCRCGIFIKRGTV